MTKLPTVRLLTRAIVTNRHKLTGSRKHVMTIWVTKYGQEYATKMWHSESERTLSRSAEYASAEAHEPQGGRAAFARGTCGAPPCGHSHE